MGLSQTKPSSSLPANKNHIERWVCKVKLCTQCMAKIEQSPKNTIFIFNIDLIYLEKDEVTCLTASQGEMPKSFLDELLSLFFTLPAL